MTSTEENLSDSTAALIIGSYLVLHTLLLVALSVMVWLASDWAKFFEFMPMLKAPKDIDPGKFALFQQLVISACAAGLGGGIFMIRAFFTKYSYGWKDKTKPEKAREWLRLKEIPRFILLPFSSPILGPISLVLAKAGAITFAGLSAGKDVPTSTLVVLSFVLGLAYHDALDKLTELSEDIFKKKSETPNPTAPTA